MCLRLRASPSLAVKIADDYLGGGGGGCWGGDANQATWHAAAVPSPSPLGKRFFRTGGEGPQFRSHETFFGTALRGGGPRRRGSSQISPLLISPSSLTRECAPQTYGDRNGIKRNKFVSKCSISYILLIEIRSHSMWGYFLCEMQWPITSANKMHRFFSGIIRKRKWGLGGWTYKPTKSQFIMRFQSQFFIRVDCQCHLAIRGEISQKEVGRDQCWISKKKTLAILHFFLGFDKYRAYPSQKRILRVHAD